jgi:hypothetical protein
MWPGHLGDLNVWVTTPIRRGSWNSMVHHRRMTLFQLDSLSETSPFGPRPLLVKNKSCLAAFISRGEEVPSGKLPEDATLEEAIFGLQRAQVETGQLLVFSRDAKLKILFSGVGADGSVLVELLPQLGEAEFATGGLCSMANAREFLALVFDGVACDRLWLLLEPLLTSRNGEREKPSRDGDEGHARLAMPFTYGEALALLD